jgi:hypothetical protein
MEGCSEGNHIYFRNVIVSGRFEDRIFPNVEVFWDFNVWQTVPDVSTVGTAFFFRVK